MSTHTDYHIPVLTKEIVEAINPQDKGVYVDATFGGGSHTRALLEANSTCKVISFDWDQEALDHNSPALQEQFGKRFVPVWGNFGHLHRNLKKLGIKKIDGLLADFGTSQHQIHEEAGFSFKHDTALDMRMSAAHHYHTAAYIINHYSEKDLADIIYFYGEDHRSRSIAREIIAYRTKKPFKTTRDLALLMEEKFATPGKRIHTATKLFQALRVEVNKEFENIRSLLLSTMAYLVPSGRIACISFHSLEDRLVKQFFNDHKDKLTIITRKPIVASEDELERNRSARSAKLRVAEKKEAP